MKKEINKNKTLEEQLTDQELAALQALTEGDNISKSVKEILALIPENAGSELIERLQLDLAKETIDTFVSKNKSMPPRDLKKLKNLISEMTEKDIESLLDEAKKKYKKEEDESDEEDEEDLEEGKKKVKKEEDESDEEDEEELEEEKDDLEEEEDEEDDLKETIKKTVKEYYKKKKEELEEDEEDIDEEDEDLEEGKKKVKKEEDEEDIDVEDDLDEEEEEELEEEKDDLEEEEEELEEEKDDLEEEEEELEEEEGLTKKQEKLPKALKDAIKKKKGIKEKDDLEEEDEEEMKEKKKKISESINDLISSERTLSEGFKANAATIFEAAVAEKAVQIQNRYNQKLEEEIEKNIDTLTEKLDRFLSIAVEEWLNKHDESITNKARIEISESFIENLKTVFDNHYISIPDSKVNLFDEISEKAADLEEKLDAAADTISTLTEKLNNLEKEKIISEVSKGLVETDIEKLKSLSEHLEYDDSDSFREKLKVVKENFIIKNGKSEGSKDLNESTSDSTSVVTRFEEDEDQIDKNSAMGKYVEALSRHTKFVK